MIVSLLIANRGEIACRVIRTARRLGIRTVAVYSDADIDALHVRMADEAVHIGPPPASESYLAGARIIAAARETGAEAIHPGYGFLSENAAFAQAVLDAGLIWVGPKPDSIRAMGLKDAAKTLMTKAGVPVTPGYLGEDQSEARLKAEADAIGYPVLIKAVAGGGGKGMRKVDSAEAFTDALTSCQREAASAFGNDRVLVEKWIASPRHIEVQVFGDQHGNVIHLFERDCSLQRRHQKVVEEAPAPGMDAATREAICTAALRAAQAVDYQGAGTIEFIADGAEGLRADRIWFMEMNTRLQVEHPVTEEVTGIDLVEWQLRIASGEPLPCKQVDLHIQGHAIEVRLYAEDPANGFLPSTGPLEAFALPEHVRVETGAEQGDAVSPYYDPMIAKLIAHGDTREEARAALAEAVGEVVAWPVRTNAGFLVKALDHPAFISGDVDTGLVARAGEHLLPEANPSEDALTDAAGYLVGIQPLAGFRLNAPAVREAMFLLDGKPVKIALNGGEDEGAEEVILAENGQSWRLAKWRIDASNAATASDGAILAPMPGRVTAVEVKEGSTVSRGQRLLVLEAMKMEHALLAPFDGTVESLMVSAGAQVDVEQILAQVTPLDR
ncbi:MAG: biotin/lipoyl-binding protein [Novosphingobium sp.]|nr:biotin/lipoyl-binding protein [Novosphingobium sp.]